MYCAIYKSAKKNDTYLYIANKDDFSTVPNALLQALGSPIFVMELELLAERKLAREESQEVMKNLKEQGWHLQMPPSEQWLSQH